MKQDWAAKKAKALWRKDMNIPQKEVARLLRAERHRAVLLCEKLLETTPHGASRWRGGHMQGVTDCINAIKGSKAIGGGT